jgi:hypothetical protein
MQHMLTWGLVSPENVPPELLLLPDGTIDDDKHLAGVREHDRAILCERPAFAQIAASRIYRIAP